MQYMEQVHHYCSTCLFWLMLQITIWFITARFCISLSEPRKETNGKVLMLYPQYIMSRQSLTLDHACWNISNSQIIPRFSNKSQRQADNCICENNKVVIVINHTRVIFKIFRNQLPYRKWEITGNNIYKIIQKCSYELHTLDFIKWLSVLQKFYILNFFCSVI